MKKIMLKLSIIPVLLLAGFIALQSFQVKVPVSNQFDDPIWFTLNSGGDETNPAHYTAAPSYNPTTNGCTGDDEMCAVKTLPDGQGEPILNIVSGRVEEGGSVVDVARTEE